MKTKTEIIEAIAKDRMVETMVTNIAHKPMSADLQDLWINNQMHFFIARIIINQYNSVNSPFHTMFRKFRLMVDETIQFPAGQYSKMDVEEADIMDTYRVLKNED